MTSEARDIVERLREPRHNEDLMKRWDSWRKYISEGGGASWPRDAFESVIDCIDEERQEAAEEIRRLREALTDMHSGWQYIRQHHGDLYGVGWDRCDKKARQALSPTGD